LVLIVFVFVVKFKISRLFAALHGYHIAGEPRAKRCRIW
jgi:hypothetical protein